MEPWADIADGEISIKWTGHVLAGVLINEAMY